MSSARMAAILSKERCVKFGWWLDSGAAKMPEGSHFEKILILKFFSLGLCGILVVGCLMA